VIAALLLAQAMVGPSAGATEAGSQVVTLTWDGDAKSCGVEIRGVGLGDPHVDGTQAAIVAALPDRWKTTILHGADAVPYKCVGDTVAALQHQGYARIGFISEPPPPPKP
jgi:hypothetical protein